MIARHNMISLLLATVGIAFPIRSAAQGNARSLETIALEVVEDIVPRADLDYPFLKIQHNDCHGFVGKIFGTDQTAALIAVEPAGNRHAKRPQEADLCLLIWKDGWSFAQNVGKVDPCEDGYPRMDWCLKRHAQSQTVYVLSHLDLYPEREHDSWVCDRETLRLKATGWPKDAVASLSGDTITLARAERPGYTPIARTIHQFGPIVKAAIVSITTTYDQQHLPTTTLSSTPPGRNAVTWIIRPKSRTYDPRHAIYALCRQDQPDPKSAFEEHASIEFDWGDNYGDGSAAMYVFHRLTGLGRAAYEGAWDEDERLPLRMPASARVTGLREAMDLFSWEKKVNENAKR